MFTTLIKSTLFFALAISGAQAAFTIDTPELVQCQDVHVVWQDGSAAPYNLVVVPADKPCDEILVNLGDHQHSSMTWKVALPQGTKVMFSLEDNTGEEAWSGVMTVKDSQDTSCLPKNSSPSSSSASPQSSSTLVVKSANAPSPSPSPSAVIVGAANAGDTPINASGASSMRHFSGAAFAITVFAVIAAITL